MITTKPLKSITVEYECEDDCHICLGSGHVCEDHPGKAWGGILDSYEYSGNEQICNCGAPGMPCPGGYP